MAISRGFPSSNSISAGVRIIEKDESFIPAEQSFHRSAIIGFASKGPINIPTLCRNRNEFHRTFGFPHPQESDPYGIYAGELYSNVSNELFYLRVADQDSVSDEQAETAFRTIPASGTQIVIQSDEEDSYSIEKTRFFRWKLNGLLSSKTLAVLDDNVEVTFLDSTIATKEAGSPYTAEQLAAHLNEQLNAEDEITFDSSEGKINVKTKLSWGPDSELEFVSVQDALYGSQSPVGLGTGMSGAEITGTKSHYPDDAYTSDGTWDFTGLSNIQLLVVTDGTNSVNVDNSVQVIDLEDIEGVSNTTAEVVDAINAAVEDLPGGFEAKATGNNITIYTLHEGQDARILVKSESTASGVFGFSGLTAVGKSPQGSTDDSAIDTYAIVNGGTNSSSETTLTLNADSPGIEGNLTQVRVTNNRTDGSFNIEVFNNGTVVESWGPLTKNPESAFYVETYVNSKSDYIRISDNIETLASPQNGIYSLTGGSDGIPSDPDKVDDLIIGNEIGFTGIYSLSEPEQFDIDLVAAPGHSSTNVILALIDLCENKRQDCMAIIDPPIGFTPREVKQWHDGVHPENTVKLNSDYAALFWPWLKMRDLHNRIDVWVPPSGAVLATIARSDQNYAPWWAAAGEIRGRLASINDAFQRPSLSDRDLLYGNQSAINPITHFNNIDDFVIYGNKTLQREPTALNRINVRRLLFVVEKRIRQRTRILLFDPHDDIFRSRFIQIASKVLEEIQVERGITNYVIDVGNHINTNDSIDRNEFRANIGIVPRKAVEFIFLQFSLHRTGAFNEPTDLF